jgi:hypothetical protein
MIRLRRKKPRNLLASVLYRLKFLIPLDQLLDLAAIMNRLAFEKASKRGFDPWGGENAFLHRHIRPSDHVVEIGCSSGRVLANVKAAKRTGIDRDESAIKQARKAHPEIAFFIGDAAAHPSGDVAILSHVLEHIDDPEGLLRSLDFKRIYVEVPDFDTPLNQVRVKRGRSLVYSDEDHVAEWDRDSLELLFAHCGLEVIDSEFRWGFLRYWLTKSNAARSASGSAH